MGSLTTTGLEGTDGRGAGRAGDAGPGSFTSGGTEWTAGSSRCSAQCAIHNS